MGPWVFGVHPGRLHNYRTYVIEKCNGGTELLALDSSEPFFRCDVCGLILANQREIGDEFVVRARTGQCAYHELLASISGIYIFNGDEETACTIYLPLIAF